MAIRLVLERGDALEVEVKHWPVPFAGIAPRVRAWLKDAETGSMVELPGVQRVETPYAAREPWEQGTYRVVFEGGSYLAMEEDVDLVGPVVLEGMRGNGLKALEGRVE